MDFSRFSTANLTTNITGQITPPPLHLLYHASIVAWLTVTLSVNVLGGLANSIIVVATLAYRPLRACSSSSLIAQSAGMDALRCFLIYPVNCLLGYLAPYQTPQEEAMKTEQSCRYIGGVTAMVIFATNWSYCCLAAHRFCAAILPHQYRALTRRSALIAINAAPWLIAALLTAFPFFKVGGLRLVATRPWAACTVGPLGYTPVAAVISVGTYLPCALACLCYVTVVVRARRAVAKRRRLVGSVMTANHRADVGSSAAGNSRSFAGVSEIQMTSTVERRYEMVRMLLVCSLMTLALTSLLPVVLAGFPVYFSGSYLAPMWLRLMQYVASAANPVSLSCGSVAWLCGYERRVPKRASSSFIVFDCVDIVNIALFFCIFHRQSSSLSVRPIVPEF